MADGGLFFFRVSSICAGAGFLAGAAEAAEVRRVVSGWGSAGGMVRIRRRRVVVVPSWTWRLHGRRRLRPARRITTRGIATTRRRPDDLDPIQAAMAAKARREREAAANGGALGHLLAGYGDATTRRDADAPPTRPSRRGPAPRRRERPRLLLEQGHGRGGVDAGGDARRHRPSRARGPADPRRTGRPARAR